MKLILILGMLTISCFAAQETAVEQDKPKETIIPKAKVLYDLGKSFEVHVKDEVMITRKTGPFSTTSHRTTLIAGHNYTGKVMDNGFVELTNEVGTILIPMRNVISIVLKNK